MDKTKIDWCDMSWNPITGCLHGCEYCYARKIAERFRGWTTSGVKTTANYFKDPPELDKPLLLQKNDGKVVHAPYPFGFKPTLPRYRLDEPARKQRPRNIFVGSMSDVFGSWVPMEWIAAVFDACKAAPQHNYLFLTKNPARYKELDNAGLLPYDENFWYGTSVTNGAQAEAAADGVGGLPGKVRTFFSIEPLTEDVAATSGWTYTNNGLYADWIIIGAATGPTKDKLKPKREWVQRIVSDAHGQYIPVFMKDNLKEVWGDDLIRKFPKQLTK